MFFQQTLFIHRIIRLAAIELISIYSIVDSEVEIMKRSR